MTVARSCGMLRWIRAHDWHLVCFVSGVLFATAMHERECVLALVGIPAMVIVTWVVHRLLREE